MKKRAFVLLEVLITIALISICSIFLVTNPIYFYKKEIQSLKSLEKIRLKKEALFDINLLLFENNISFESISSKNKSSAPVFFLNKKKIKIKNILNKKIPIYYRIWTEQQKIGNQDQIYKKLAIEIAFNPFLKKEKHFTHYLLCQKTK